MSRATAPADLEGLEDPELVRLAQSGNPRAADLLFSRHRRSLTGYLKSRYGFSTSVAEDIVQHACVRAYRHLHRFDPDRSSWRSWLHTIAINLGKNELRNRERQRDDVRITDLEGDGDRDPSAHSGPFLVDPTAAADDLQRRHDLRKVIVSAAEKLPPHHRVVFVLREFENRTYEEIEEAVGIGMGTVKSRLSRARNEFREALEELDPEIAEEYAADRRTKRPRSV